MSQTGPNKASSFLVLFTPEVSKNDLLRSLSKPTCFIILSIFFETTSSCMDLQGPHVPHIQVSTPVMSAMV